MVLCWEDDALTQILTALGLEARWRVLAPFAEYGAWDREAIERPTLRLLEQERPARWGCYHPVAVDDTKRHRTSTQVWGTCTFHEARARSPHRAETGRAHHWVGMGPLLPGRPWPSRGLAARLSSWPTQLPVGEPFRTKTALAVELLRQAEGEARGPLLATFDGAYAVNTVLRPCLEPEPGQRRIARVTRRRAAARLHHPGGLDPTRQGGGPPGGHGSRRPNPIGTGRSAGRPVRPGAMAGRVVSTTNSAGAAGRSAGLRAPCTSW